MLQHATGMVAAEGGVVRAVERLETAVAAWEGSRAGGGPIMETSQAMCDALQRCHARLSQVLKMLTGLPAS